MDRLYAIKIRQSDGTYGAAIPINVLAENVDWNDSLTLVDILGQVDTSETIQDQINNLKNSKANQTTVNALDQKVDNAVEFITHNSEVAEARVGVDDTSYSSLKERLDGEYDKLEDGIEENKSLYQQYTGTVQTLIAEIREDLEGVRNQVVEAEHRVFFGYNYLPYLDWNTLLGSYAADYSLQASAYNSQKNTVVFSFSAVSGDANGLLIETDTDYTVQNRAVLSINHSNDLTYNPRTNKIYSANGEVNGRIDVINTGTLSLESPINVGLSVPVANISYDNVHDQYFICTTDHQVYLMDSDFNVTLIGALPYNSDPTVYGHDNVRAVYYQGSEIVNGRFVVILWLYGTQNNLSYTRLYSFSTNTNEVQDYIEIPTRYGTYEEVEALSVVAGRVYLYGYINNDRLTVTEVFPNGIYSRNPPLFIENGEFSSLDDIPLNGYGVATFKDGTSPIATDLRGAFVSVGDITSRSVTLYRYGETMSYTNIYNVSTGWSGWRDDAGPCRHVINGYYSSLDAIPTNAYGTCTLSADVSPIGTELSGAFYAFGDTGQRFITILRASLNVAYTNTRNASGWQGWTSNSHRFAYNNVLHTFEFKDSTWSTTYTVTQDCFIAGMLHATSASGAINIDGITCAYCPAGGATAIGMRLYKGQQVALRGDTYSSVKIYGMM